MIAANIAPGMNRTFTAADLDEPDSEGSCGMTALEEAKEMVNTDIEADIQGYDIDA